MPSEFLKYREFLPHPGDILVKVRIELDGEIHRTLKVKAVMEGKLMKDYLAEILTKEAKHGKGQGQEEKR